MAASERTERRTLVLVLAAVLGLVLGFRPIADMDFHWHLATGEAWLEGRLPATEDVFSWVPTVRDPDMGSAGGDVVFALVHGVAGMRGIQWLVALLVAALLVVAARLALRELRSDALAVLFLALVAAVITHRVRARPDLFSLLGVFLLVDVLHRRPSPRRLGALFGGVALWVNLHPGAAIAPVLAAAAVPGPDWRRRLMFPVLAGAGLLLNLRGPLFLPRLVLDTGAVSEIIPEWATLWNLPFERFAGELVLTAVVASGFVLAAGSGAWRRVGFVLGAVALLLSLRSVRFVYLLAVPGLFVLAHGARPPWLVRGAVPLAVVLVIAMPSREMAKVVSACRESGLAVTSPVYTPNYPVGAADWLERRHLKGRLFHPVRWGGYLAWRLESRYRTGHDGRISLYGLETARELLTFADPAARPTLVDRWRMEILVLPPGVLAAEEIASLEAPADPRRRWLPVYDDGIATVFVDRRGRHWEHNRRILRRSR